MSYCYTSQWQDSSALNVYHFPEDFKFRPDIACNKLRYLYQAQNKPEIKKYISLDVLRQKCTALYEEAKRNNNVQIMSEITDIFLQFVPAEGQRLLEELRDNNINEIIDGRIERKNNEAKRANDIAHNRAADAKVRSIYNDTQNVHDSTINRSVLEASKYLYSLYEKRILQVDKDEKDPRMIEERKDLLFYQIRNEICREIYHHIITPTLDYIQNATATFTINLTLRDIFMSLWLWIKDYINLHPENKENIYARIVEEFDSAKHMCSTGHLARLINILQGFTEDKKLCIKISDKEQYKNVICRYLTKCLQDCEDEKVQDGMISHNEEYKTFIRESVKEKLLSWIEEYGEGIMADMPKIVNTFSNTEIFKDKLTNK